MLGIFQGSAYNIVSEQDTLVQHIFSGWLFSCERFLLWSFALSTDFGPFFVLELKVKIFLSSRDKFFVFLCFFVVRWSTSLTVIKGFTVYQRFQIFECRWIFWFVCCFIYSREEAITLILYSPTFWIFDCKYVYVNVKSIFQKNLQLQLDLEYLSHSGTMR